MLGLNAVSEVLAETAESARASDAALISGQTVGVKSANLFSGFTDSGLTISGSGSTRQAFLAGGVGGPLLQSTYSCRDSEITVTRPASKEIFLRYSGDRALGISMAGAQGQVRVGWVYSLLDINNTVRTVPSFSNAFINVTIQLSDFIPGKVAFADTDVVVFGAVGKTIYASYNGVEIYRATEWRQPDAGTAVVWTNGDGVNDVSISYIPTPLTYGNRAKRLYDIRDFGAKEFSTTGSITASSNQLVVADASGLAVGDRVIVPTSSEAGLGLPGTMGVGGAWPALSYASTAAMNADTGQATAKRAWDRSSGLVYYWSGSAWVVNTTGTSDVTSLSSNDQGEYYTWRACPKALVATITAKAGTTLTLDQTASATVSGAAVYFDCYAGFFPLIDTTWGSNQMPSGITLRIPSGNFPLGQAILGDTTKRISWTVRGVPGGASRVFAPRGAPNLQITFTAGSDGMMHSFTAESNHKPNAADSDRPIYYSVPEAANGSFSGGWAQTFGMNFHARGIMKDLAVIDTIGPSHQFNVPVFGSATRCTLTMNARIMAYTQWYFAADNGNDVTFTECQVTYSRGLIKGFETFVGTNHSFISCGGYNVLCSTNNSYNWLYQDFHSDIYAGSFSFVNAGYWNEAVINVNNNSFHSASVGGRVVRPRIIQHGYCTSNNDTIPFIQVASDVPNVVISGEYDADTPAFVTTKGGYLEAPDYAVINTGLQVRGIGPSVGRGVIIEAPGTVVTGLRVVGATKSGQYNIGATATATGSTLTGNIADTFSFAATVTKSGNRTNAGVSVP